MNISTGQADFGREGIMLRADREDLQTLLETYSTDLKKDPDVILGVSDQKVKMAEQGLWRLPSLSAIEGFGFVKQVSVTEVHRYTYSPTFNRYILGAMVLADEIGDLERHAFTHGLAYGLIIKRRLPVDSYA